MPEKIFNEKKVERRRHKRLKQKFSVKFKKFIFPFSNDNSLWHKGIIANISGCGVFIQAQKDFLEDDLKIGDMLHLEIELGKWNEYKANDRPFDYYYQREPLTVLGKIVRLEESDGKRFIYAGIDFVGVDESHKIMVLKYIEKKLKNNGNK